MSGMDLKKAGFATRVIHAGQEPEKVTGALSTPVFQTSTFCFETTEEGAGKFEKSIPGYVYSRLSNPTTRALELKIAAIENGEDCVATASGMGAVGSMLVGLLKTGDHIICDEIIYGGTSVVLLNNMPQFGIDVTFVDTANPAAVEAAVTPKTKLIYFETPANPTMKVVDIKAVVAVAKKHGIKVAMDNTFAPPPIQYPLNMGVDIVLHSVTKYLNGHGDVVGGAVVGSAEDICAVRSVGVAGFCGTPPSPFNSYLALRGMKTLKLRVLQHCANALAVARYLEKQPNVRSVYYPGLESHPAHELCRTQMNGLYTGMVSFELKEGIKGMSAFEAGKKFLNGLKLTAVAVSLGDPDSLIEHPASMTHSSVPKEIREASGITDGLIRFSAGLEDAEDLIADFEQSFMRL